MVQILKKNILFYLFILSFTLSTLDIYSQASISGVINFYTAVDSIYPTNDTLLVSDASPFTDGDTIMVYQMKGAEVETDTATILEEFFGKIQFDGINSAGKYEIVIVEKVDANEVILRNELLNPYNVDHLVQIIKVPSYNSVNITGELTCDSWDGEKGGVLVFMVNDTINLNANINVVGKGYRGGNIVTGDGDCASSDSLTYRSVYFDNLFNGAGEKGEGVAINVDTLARGYGYWSNAGGGGNARFSGGGGGSNAGTGGSGGEEDTSVCKTTPAYVAENGNVEDWGGLGGRGGQQLFNFAAVSNYINDSTVFMGGGGGSGTRTVSFAGVNGGSGGGVVIIIAKHLISNNYSIFASGQTPSDSEASGGGGGGGGSIVFDVDSVQGDIKLDATGGNGGNIAPGFMAGPGGGGGGGVVLFGTSQKPGMTVQVEGGDGGQLGIVGSTISHGAAIGNLGHKFNSIKVPLNGFLFNSITAKQEICNGDSVLISGSQPRGGYTGVPYVYQWEESTDGIAWNPIAGATDKDYQTSALTDTMYYKRIVTNGDIIDAGIILDINVQTTIVGNSIIGDDLVTCIGNQADTIMGTRVVVGGNNIDYTYIWQYKWDVGSWTNIDTHDDTIYWPGTVEDTTFIRRVVVSGACYDTAYLASEIIGLPQITSNNIYAYQEICDGETPDALTADAPENGLGAGTYSYLWQERTNTTSWVDIGGATNPTYQPGSLNDTTYYRRIVFSDDCVDESDSVLISVLPDIFENNIENLSPLYTCYNTAPVELIGSEPKGGNSIDYYYQWQDSVDGGTWENITEQATNINYLPVALSDTTFYRRTVVSSACKDTSEMVKIKILDLPVGNITTLTDTICSEDDVTLNFDFTDIGIYPLNLSYTNGTDIFNTTVNNAGEFNIVVNPTSTETKKTYLYEINSLVDDSGCVAVSIPGLTTVHVYGNPNANAGMIIEDTCAYNYVFKAVPSLGTGEWSQIEPSAGNTTFADINDPKTAVQVDASGEYTYQWKETNWECVDSVSTTVSYYMPVSSIYAGKDTILNFIESYTLNATFDDPDDGLIPVYGEWIELYDIVLDQDDIITGNTLDLMNLPNYFGSEINYVWQVQKGDCPLLSDTVTLTIQDLFAPEKLGFTPNGDGPHDYLKFEGIQYAESNELIIFNRWGTEVFSKKNFPYEPGWDAKNNDGKDLPDDTYFYVLQVTRTNGKTSTFKGFIVIKRY